MSQQKSESPCIGVCTVADNGLCMGCFRTLHEIANWLSLSESERRQILQQLDSRMDRMFS
jgi:predicted Fe-S protein YdhL (DUF1289 family)